MEVKTAEVEVKAAERLASGGPPAEPKARSLYDAFLKTVAKHGDEVAIRTHGDQFTITWTDMAARVAAIAGGLAKLGVRKGDSVAMMHNNRPEYPMIDMAAVSLGAIPFSLYQTSPPDQISYIVQDAGARVAIVEEVFLDTFRKAETPSVETIVSIDGESGDHSLAEVEQMDPGFEPDVEAVGLDDLLTLIYTSGTTGPPKGVQLTHRNLMGLVAGIDGIIEFPERGAKVISWLPAAHIAERGANYYLPVSYGIQINICPDPRQIVDFLPEVRPSFFFAVPRIWEKAKAGIEAKIEGEASGVRKRLAQWAIATGLEKARAEQAALKGGSGPGRVLGVKHAVADKLVLSKLREKLGLDEAASVNVGAAPTPYEVLEFFHGVGIPVGELWGMSETCGAATCNRPGEVKLGTVGPPLPGFEIKIAEDGEVLVRGIGIMEGYRNMPEKTAETIDSEGWLATGDIGELDEDGFLKIVDRKKELIINAAGKNMSPANIESQLKAASPLIGQAAAIGDGRPYNTALIVLDPDYAPSWAQQHGIGASSVEDLAGEEKVREEIGRAVEKANAALSRIEQVKKFTILPTEWQPGGEELTPTMKLRRKPIAERYAEEIEAMYLE